MGIEGDFFGNNPLVSMARAARPVQNHKNLGLGKKMIRYIWIWNMIIDIKKLYILPHVYGYGVLKKIKENRYLKW